MPYWRADPFLLILLITPPLSDSGDVLFIATELLNCSQFCLKNVCFMTDCFTSASWKRADCLQGFPSGAAERDNCEHTIMSALPTKHFIHILVIIVLPNGESQRSSRNKRTNYQLNRCNIKKVTNWVKQDGKRLHNAWNLNADSEPELRQDGEKDL